MIVDIAIAVSTVALMVLMAFLGVYVTMHPAKTKRNRSIYSATFVICGVLACILIGVQTYRNSMAQSSLQSKLESIGINTSKTNKAIRGLPTASDIARELVKIIPNQIQKATQASEQSQRPSSAEAGHLKASRSPANMEKGIEELKSLIVGQRWGLNAEQLELLSRREVPYASSSTTLIDSVLGDAESTQFAASLAAAFRAAHWDLPGAGFRQTVFRGPLEGVVIQVHAQDANPPGLAECVTSLREANIQPAWEVDAAIPESQFQIIVGSKPQAR